MVMVDYFTIRWSPGFAMLWYFWPGTTGSHDSTDLLKVKYNRSHVMRLLVIRINHFIEENFRERIQIIKLHCIFHVLE